MNAHTVVDLLRQALLATFWISLPILTIGLLAGIVMSLVQIVTSMQDTAVGHGTTTGCVPGWIVVLAAVDAGANGLLHHGTVWRFDPLCPLNPTSRSRC